MHFRVSIPFIAGQWSLGGSQGTQGGRTARFNPLHCGAVVAYAAAGVWLWRSYVVSIPFIAGQWSLLTALSRRTAGGQSFNPLHCGAVVACEIRDDARQNGYSFNPLHCGAVVASLALWRAWRAEAAFQSPSLRGSGRFGRPR